MKAPFKTYAAAIFREWGRTHERKFGDKQGFERSLQGRLKAEDLFRIKVIERPQISPDGREIVFARKSFNPAKNQYVSCLCRISAERFNARPERLTRGPADSHPIFSPDGKRIVFLRKIRGFKQLFLLSRRGGGVRPLSRIKHDVADPVWSPDGRKIAFTAAVPEKGLIPAGQKSPGDLFQKYNQDVKVINRIWYKLDGDGFLHDKRRQIFLLDLQTGKMSQLTFGPHEAGHPCFSPDGRTVVFESLRAPDSDYEPQTHLYAVAAAGGEPRALTDGNYAFSHPVFSPDGEWIAFTGCENPYNWYANVRLWVLPARGGKAVCLTPDCLWCAGDVSLNDLRELPHGEAPAWSPDSRKIYVSASDRGETYLTEINLNGRILKTYRQELRVVNEWHTASKSPWAVLNVSDPGTPNDLWSVDLASGKFSRLTEINAAFTRVFFLSQPEAFSAASADGTRIDAWILKPPDFESGKKYPAVLEIHGGPMAMYAWSFFFEFQLLAHHGYAVVYSNPRGSLGYGQAFCEAIKGDWGNLDYQDVMAVLDEALAAGFIDEKRLGVAGGSYGGFMTNWAIGHTGRFKAAVAMRSVANEYSMFGTSDYGFWGDHNLDCLPWENPDAYLRMSPLSYADKMKTPLLLLHAEEDLRCPVEQAEQLFAALKKLKREAVFIRFPGESHDLSRSGKPWHRVCRLKQILEWFNRYLLA